MDEHSKLSLATPLLLPSRRGSEQPTAASLTTVSDPPDHTSQITTRVCPTCRGSAEWLELRWQAGFWKSSSQRCQQREERLRQQIDAYQRIHWPRLLEESQERERLLQERLATLQAQRQEHEDERQQQVAKLQSQILVLEQRLRGRKSAKKKKHSAATTAPPTAGPRRRGQQPNNPAPRRRTFDHLPGVDETCQLTEEQARCPQCGAAFAAFPGTDDGDLLEIDVRAYRRRYHRRRYRKTCTCAATPALPTAPPPPKLIPKGYVGISVWVLLLLEKYAAYQPTYRFLNLLASLGMDLPVGTITAGLKKLVPLFEPLYHGLAERQRQEHHWHCDETRWLVFCDYEGKVGHSWGLWAFCSPQAVVYVLDPSRAHDVPQTYLAEASGIASVDRATVFKAMAQVKQGQIVLAFGWAHVRRDFLEVLTGYGELNDWVVSWSEDIRQLYHLNEQRVQALLPAVQADPGTPWDGTPAAAGTAEQRLREHVAHIARRRDAELAQPQLHPACTKVLTSLRNHWSGLTVFLDHPEVPLDNNAAERAERGPALARKNYYGSGALWSGRLAALMFSLFRTLAVWHLCPLRWLTAYLTACAEAGARPPENALAFLPWNLTAEQKQQWGMPTSRAHAPDGVNSS